MVVFVYNSRPARPPDLYPVLNEGPFHPNILLEPPRNEPRHKLRSFLTISGIVIGVLALTTMGALAENFNALIDGGVKYFGGSIQVGPPDGAAANFLPISKVEEIKKVDGVAAAFPSYQFSAKPRGTFAYINLTDGQMLLKDSLPAALQTSFDVTQITEGISVYGKPGASLPKLDKIADQINSQVTGVKATKPSDLVNGFKSGGAIFTAITTAAPLPALIIGGLPGGNTSFLSAARRVGTTAPQEAVGPAARHMQAEFPT